MMAAILQFIDIFLFGIIIIKKEECRTYSILPIKTSMGHPSGPTTKIIPYPSPTSKNQATDPQKSDLNPHIVPLQCRVLKLPEKILTQSLQTLKTKEISTNRHSVKSGVSTLMYLMNSEEIITVPMKKISSQLLLQKEELSMLHRQSVALEKRN